MPFSHKKKKDSVTASWGNEVRCLVVCIQLLFCKQIIKKTLSVVTKRFSFPWISIGLMVLQVASILWQATKRACSELEKAVYWWDVRLYLPQPVSSHDSQLCCADVTPVMSKQLLSTLWTTRRRKKNPVVAIMFSAWPTYTPRTNFSLLFWVFGKTLNDGFEMCPSLPVCELFWWRPIYSCSFFSYIFHFFIYYYKTLHNYFFVFILKRPGTGLSTGEESRLYDSSFPNLQTVKITYNL